MERSPPPSPQKKFPRKKLFIPIIINLVFWTVWLSFGIEEAHAFKCCWDHQFSADSETECAEHYCYKHGAQDSCDFLGVGDSSEETGGSSAPSGMGSSATESTVVLSPATEAAIEQLGYALGQQMARALVGPTAAEKAAAAEHRRAVTAEMQRQADEIEEASKEKFAGGKNELLEQIKRSASAELQPQELDVSRKLDFESYQKRVNETRETLEDLRDGVAAGKVDKATLDWCILNMPLYPTQPILPIPENQYQTMLQNYWKRKSAWDTRCQAGDRAGQGGTAGSLPFKDLSPPPEPAAGTVGIEPKSWGACLNDYNRHLGGCGKGDNLNERMGCINNAIKEWQQCIKRDS